MTEGEIRKMIDQAAEKGACEALKRVGLSDQYAGRDIRELRELIYAWRDIRKTARRALVRLVIKGILITLVAGVAFYFWKLP